MILKLFSIWLILCYAIPSVKPNDDNRTTTTTEQPPTTFDNTNGRGFSRDCSKLYSITCLKLDVISFVEKLSENDNYTLLPGVNVIREPHINDVKTSDLVAELARDFPYDAEARLDAFLMKKLESYLRTHSIRFALLDNKDSNVAESARGGGGGYGGGGGGGGGKKDKGGMGAILAAGAMMKGVMLMMAMAGVAAVAGKALMASMIALVMAGIIGIKSLIGGGHKSTTYEIVSKPIYTQSHTHSSSHEDHSGGYGYGHSRSWKEAAYLPHEQVLASQEQIKFSLPASVYLNKMN